MVDFKTSNYFSGLILFLGIILVPVGLLLMVKSIVLGIAILFVAMWIFTTHYRLSVDFDKHEFHDYLWIFGFKRGVKGKFEKMEYIFIKKSRVSQKMNSRASTTIIRTDVYDGFLKFSEKEKIHLMTEDKRETLKRKLDVIARKLKVEIVDYSEEG
ncbi:MAG TPA: hypothetical protein PK156_35050 [Polyangium sp.]|nr:hypothetical protein [Polyangium sp.]